MRPRHPPPEDVLCPGNGNGSRDPEEALPATAAPVETCFPGGQRKSSGWLFQGKRWGRWTFWFASGGKRSEGGYRDGVFHGPFTLWWESGVIRECGAYVDGKPHGRFVKWDEKGELLKETVFHHGDKVGS